MVVRGKLFALLLIAACSIALAIPLDVSATPPNCVLEGTNLFVGGIETAVVSTAHGVAGDTVPRAPALCQHVSGLYESAASAWVMQYRADNPFDYHQVGWEQNQDQSTAHFFSEWNDGGVPHTEFSPSPPTWGTRYRLMLKKTATAWDGYVLLDSDGSMVWNAPNDPATHPWNPTEGKYSGETWNHSDRMGGTSGSPATLDTLRWYNSADGTVFANITGADRVNSYPSHYFSSWGADNYSFNFWSNY